MITANAFQDKVIALRPTNFMALNGNAAGMIGSVDSGSNAVEQLKRVVIDFVGYYKENSNEAYIAAARKEVLAKIMVALTMDAITQEKADELVDDLQSLMYLLKEGN